MKKKQEKEVAKLQSDFADEVRRNEDKCTRLSSKLSKAKDEVSKQREQWESKLLNLNNELTKSSDRLYLEKRKRRDTVQEQVNKSRAKETEMQNYIDGLDERNADLSDELSLAIKEKKAAVKLSKSAKALAAKRLEKWHAEVNTRRELQDKIALQDRILIETENVLDYYKAAAESNAAHKKQMKKEWLDEAAKSKRGGRQSWPVWVVQLICELLVNGTPPSAIPGNIQIMFETLYNEKPADIPSVNFVRECRPIVEVIGETVAALKLADAQTWDQLWTDGTTRRQIPFTALIIGIMGTNDKIDPVVISSCIFMEDETSESQAEGIVNKVSLCILFYPVINTRVSNQYCACRLILLNTDCRGYVIF